jgi:putative DNA primase/helicase
MSEENTVDVLVLLAFDGLATDPPMSEVEDRLRAMANSLSGADPLRRAAVRAAAIRRLEALGVRGPARLVDAALAGLSAPAADSGTGRMIAFEELEPWPDPVDGVQLLDEIAQTFRRFVVLPEGGAEALALWCVFTHAIDAFDVAPMIILTSPLMRCGKTRTEEIAAGLVRRPLPSSNITPAALFRSIEKYAPTLLADEADTFVKNNPELAGVLNSGHTRATAFVIRTVGDDHEPRAFSTWGARMLALIGRVPFATLEDRGIVIKMRRRRPSEPVKRLRRRELPGLLNPLHRRAARWAVDVLPALGTAEPADPEGLNDRAADNWRPLLAIADHAGGTWPDYARQAARRLSGLPEERRTAGVELLADIRALFGDKGAVLTRAMMEGLNKLEERPWATWNRGNPITDRQLADLLRDFDVKSKPLWIEGKTQRGYDLSKFRDPFERYLAPQEVQDPQDSNGDMKIDRTSHPQEGGALTLAKCGVTTDGDGTLAPLANGKPEEGNARVYEL